MPPLQPQGYVKLAYLFGRYPDAAVFRRFGHLEMINLLSLQAKLVALDEEYTKLWQLTDNSKETEVKAYSTYFYSLHRFATEDDVLRAKLSEIQMTMKEYRAITSLMC